MVWEHTLCDFSSFKCNICFILVNILCRLGKMFIQLLSLVFCKSYLVCWWCYAVLLCPCWFFCVLLIKKHSWCEPALFPPCVHTVIGNSSLHLMLGSSTRARVAGARAWCGLGGALGWSWQAGQSPRQFSIYCLCAVTRSKQDCVHTPQTS